MPCGGGGDPRVCNPESLSLRYIYLLFRFINALFQVEIMVMMHDSSSKVKVFPEFSSTKNQGKKNITLVTENLND
jgi:hypothetical protein